MGIVGISSNKIGEFSCVYIQLSDFTLFTFVEAAVSMNVLLMHTDVTPFFAKHLEHMTDRKNMLDPIMGYSAPHFLHRIFRPR
jgi:hypothetical protein